MRKLFYIIFSIFMYVGIPAVGQIVAIPDSNFRVFLKTNYGSAMVGDELNSNLAAGFTGAMNCSGKAIRNMEGLQYFIGITSVDVSNNRLESFNQVSFLNNLQTLHMEDNFLTSLPSLTNLTKLKVFIASNNMLTTLPSLSTNTQLTQIIVLDNQLTALPDLRSLTNLQKMDVRSNQLSITPDVSSNLLLTQLSLDNNSLTVAPDISSLTNLTKFQIHQNYLTFEDINSLYPHPNSQVFVVFPQKKLPVPVLNLIVYQNDSLVLSTGIDHSLSSVKYAWYSTNSGLIISGLSDTLIIPHVNINNSGNYYCVLTNPSFLGDTIKTDTIRVDVKTCPDITSELILGSVTCLEAGSLEVKATSSLPPHSYHLCAPYTGDSIVSTSGFFKGLNQPEYTLTIKTAVRVCQVIIPVSIPYENCKEVFITPDGDGDKDSHYFPYTGTVVIYDKNGNAVQTLAIPGEWNGYSKSGKLVAPGYYFADVNKGAESINISVLY